MNTQKYVLEIVSWDARGQKYYQQFDISDPTAYFIGPSGTLQVTEIMKDGRQRIHHFSPSGWLECWVVQVTKTEVAHERSPA